MVSGRPRPPYEPLAVRCAHCGAPLEVPDERAQLVVCTRCDKRNELTGAERDTLRALSGSNNPVGVSYPLALGQSFRWRGSRYEVMARLMWIEEGSLEYTTRVYVLYHPARPLLFLDEYHGAWTLMHKTHVQAVGNPAAVEAGQKLRTHDGRRWTCDEVVVRELYAVDGALPWVAEVGDKVRAAELSSDEEAFERLEVEWSKGEVELNRGTVLTSEQLQRAMPDVPDLQVRVPRSPGQQRRSATMMMAAGALGVALNLGLLGFASAMGVEVMTDRLTADELTAEALTRPFTLTTGDLVRIDLDAVGLSNAWMAVQLAVVESPGSTTGQEDEARDRVLHVTDAELSYYSGRDSDGSWSEGSRDTSLLVRGLAPGEYRLLLQAVSNTGSSESASAAQHDLGVRVVDGAKSTAPAKLGFGLSLLLGVLGFLMFKASSPSEED